MMRKFKALGLTFVAAFAISAVVASAGHATSGTVTAEGKATTVTAEQTGEHVIALTDHQLGAGGFFTFKCKKAHFDGVGTVTDGATSVTVTPTYSECTMGGLPVTVSHEGCNYLLATGTPTTGSWHVNMSVICPAGKAIRFVAQTCEFTIGTQGPLTTSSVTNSGGGGTAMDLQLHTNVSGIHYVVHKDGIGCPLTKTGTFIKGDYAGTSTVKGLDALGNVVGITLH